MVVVRIDILVSVWYVNKVLLAASNKFGPNHSAPAAVLKVILESQVVAMVTSIFSLMSQLVSRPFLRCMVLVRVVGLSTSSIPS